MLVENQGRGKKMTHLIARFYCAGQLDGVLRLLRSSVKDEFVQFQHRPGTGRNMQGSELEDERFRQST